MAPQSRIVMFWLDPGLVLVVAMRKSAASFVTHLFDMFPRRSKPRKSHEHTRRRQQDRA